MAWEKRKGYEYYYRSIRLPGGRVVKRYFGNGAAAEIEARRVQDRAEQRRRDKRAIMGFCAEVGPADELLASFEHQIQLLIDAAMFAAGYHKRRSEWRKRGCQGRPRKTTEPPSRNRPKSRPNG